MIILRSTHSDYKALQIANAIEKAGARVICVTDGGPRDERSPLFGQPDPCRFVVWARVEDEAQIAEVDKAIEKERQS